MQDASRNKFIKIYDAWTKPRSDRFGQVFNLLSWEQLIYIYTHYSLKPVQWNHIYYDPNVFSYLVSPCSNPPVFSTICCSQENPNTHSNNDKNSQWYVLPNVVFITGWGRIVRYMWRLLTPEFRVVLRSTTLICHGSAFLGPYYFEASAFDGTVQ